MKILVTGATGNVGGEVIRQLAGSGHAVFAGVRGDTWRGGAVAGSVAVDFERPAAAAGHFDAILLVRPPHLTDPALFARFLEPHDRQTRIVFLSVQGAGEKSWLPHARIERRIAELGFPHVFVRPSYFMENLLTTLWPELAARRRIYLPAGRLALDWISVRDVASVCAAALTGKVARPAVAVCSGRRAGFAEACAILNAEAGTRLTYRPASLPGYIRHCRRTGDAWSRILVMLLLHFLPRFQQSGPPAACDTAAILGRPPETLAEFVRRNRARFAALA